MGSVGNYIHLYRMLFAGKSGGDEDGDTDYLRKAKAVSARCFEFSMFLVDVLRITDLGAKLGLKVDIAVIGP